MRGERDHFKIILIVTFFHDRCASETLQVDKGWEELGKETTNPEKYRERGRLMLEQKPK